MALGQVLGTGSEVWLNIQRVHKTATSEGEDKMADLKSKLNALAADQAEQVQKKQEESKAYRAKLLHEYPRLVTEMLVRSRRLLDGIDNLTISEQLVTQQLTIKVGAFGWTVDRGTYDDTRIEVLGDVSVPEWTISFLGRQMKFQAAGTDAFLVHGVIDVMTNYNNPFPRGRIAMLSHRNRPDAEWFLAILDQGNGRPVMLTDELLSKIFELYFSSKF